uniref:Uncharacterized protein n=1 Tax=Oryzias sinensis TaxID=183150 RepID=A0A8C7YD39_9TELE
ARLPLCPDAVLFCRNVVSVVDLGCRLDLGAIGKALWNTQYNPKTYTGLIMRIRKPRTTANIYSTGKMVCTAACSIEESRQAARRHARILQKAGFPVRFLNFRVINCVFSKLPLDTRVLAS